MELEKLATSAVTSEIAKTDILSSFINSGDKEPCWDGNIYIHEEPRKTKKNIKKVATQVKGKAVSPKQVKRTIAYPIDHDDLHAYMMNGGTMFFVVYIDKDCGDTLQIYYTDLLPVKIKDLFKNKKKKYSLKFRKFPPDKLRKTEIFINFYEDAKKQVSFAGKDLPTIDDLEKQGVLESLTFGYTGFGQNIDDFSFPKRVDGNPMTIYANIKGGAVPIPVEYYESITNVVMQRENYLPISVNGITYYSKSKTTVTAEYIEQRIGSSVSIRMQNTGNKHDSSPVAISIELKGNLRERIKAIEFISAIFEHEYFMFGSTKLPAKFPKENLERIQSHSFQEKFKYYKQVQALLDSMNVKKDLEIGKCSEDDFRKLDFLIAAIMDKRPVHGNPDDWNKIHNINIANLNLAIICIQGPADDYLVFDYFGNHFDIVCVPDGSTQVAVSQFYLLNAEDYLTLDNLNLQTIIDDFKRIPASDQHVDYSNNSVLAMLKAYDKKPSAELLDAALQITEWLAQYPDYISKSVVTLNRLQILLRSRSLTFTEKSELYAIVTNIEDAFSRIGAFLLLDEQEEAKAIFDSLTEAQIARFKEFPIYKFYKFSEEDVENEQT